MDIGSAIRFFPKETGDKKGPSTWADLGCGTGLFTGALSGFLAEGSTVYAVDRQNTFQQQLKPGISSVYLQADFTAEISALKELDGVVMANAIHFAKNQEEILGLVFSYLRPGGQLLMIEYDTARANRWVPYPIPAETLEAMLGTSGFSKTRLIHRQPSAYGRADLYSLGAVR